MLEVSATIQDQGPKIKAQRPRPHTSLPGTQMRSPPSQYCNFNILPPRPHASGLSAWKREASEMLSPPSLSLGLTGSCFQVRALLGLEMSVPQ